MAAGGAPAARCLTVLLTLAVLLGHPGQALGLQGAGAAAVNPPSSEEMTSSLVVNQLALLQLMQDSSNAASVMAERDERREEESAARDARLQDMVKGLRAMVENATQETLTVMEDKEARREEDSAARDARLQDMMKVIDSLQEEQKDLRAMVENATQETLTGVAAQQEALRQELASDVISLREEMTAQGRLLEKVHKFTTLACPNGWLRHESSCYLVDDKSLTWEESLAYCRGFDGDLAKITSAEEQNFIKGHLQGSTWIGLNDGATENHWVWTDGSAPTYTAWYKGEPNNADGGEDCVAMRDEFDYTWNDYPCSREKKVVCERPVGA